MTNEAGHGASPDTDTALRDDIARHRADRTMCAAAAALAASVLCAVLGGGNAAAVLLFLAAAGLFLRDMHLTGSRLGAELCGHAALAFLLAMLLEAYGLAGRFALLTMVGFFLVSLGMRLGVTALRDAFLPGCAR